MATTPILQLPYPTQDDAVDVPRDVQALAEAVEARGAFIIGEVRLLAGGVPGGWLLCDGRAVSRNAYPALFTAIGERYGAGDGSTTFNLPPASGRALVAAGQGAGLTNRQAGSRWGTESEPIAAGMIPHTHTGAAPDHLHGVGSYYVPDHGHPAAASGSTAGDASVQQLGGGSLLLARGGHTHEIYVYGSGAFGIGGSSGAADRGLGFTTSGPSAVSGGAAQVPNSQPSIAIPAYIYAAA